MSTVLTSNSKGSITLSNLGSGTYSNVKVALNGCDRTDPNTLILTASGAPTFTVAKTDPGCDKSDGSLTLIGLSNNTPYSLSYSFNGKGLASTISSNGEGSIIISDLASGTYTDVKLSVNGCDRTEPSTFNLAARTAPSFKVTKIDPSCGGNDGSLTLTELGDNATYSVSYAKNGTAVGQKSVISSSGQIKIDNLGAGEYSSIKIITNGCDFTNASTYELKTPGSPDIPTSDTLIKYCIREISKPLIAAGQNLKWYNSETSLTAITTPTPNTTMAGTSYYYVSQTAEGCESGRLKVKVVITDGPQLKLATQNPSCAKANGRLTFNNLAINTGYTVSYQKNGSVVGPKLYTSTSSGTVVIDSLLGGNYSKINIATSSCATTDDETYVLKSAYEDEILPPLVNSPVIYCEGDTAKGLSTSDANDMLVWYRQIADLRGQLLAPIPNTNVAGETIYYVSKKIGECESGKVGILVRVNPAPTFTVATSDPTDCKQANGIISIGNLSANTKYALSYWKDGVTVINETTSNSNGIINNNNLEKGNYSKITVKYNGCTRVDPGKYALDSPTSARMPQVVTPVVYCKNAVSEPLTAIGEDLLWYTSQEGQSSTIAPSPSTMASGSTNYYVSSNTGGCESLKALITVSVREAIVDAGIDQKVCKNVNSINLTGKVNALNNEINWISTGTGRFIPSSQSLVTTYQMSQSDIEEGKVTLALQTAPSSGCNASDSLSIVVLDEKLKLRSVTNVNPDNGTIVVNWDDLGTDKISSPMTLRRRKISPTISEYQLLSDKIKSIDFAYTDTQVDTLSIYEYKLDYKNSCDVQLEAGIHNNIVLKPNLDGDTNLIKLQWNEYKGWETGVLKYEVLRKVNQEQLYNEVSTVSKSATDAIISDIKYIRQCYVVKAIPKEGFGYSYSNEYCVGRKISLVVSNAFSPNGDNKNDVWVIEDLEYHKDNQVRVYNQWNNLVFQKKGYNNDWDGGNLPDGTYYYVVEADGIVVKPGSLLIMR